MGSRWAQRRRTYYVSSIIGILLIFIIPIIFLMVYDPATCFDGKINQGETKIDRGGPCQLLDAEYVAPVLELWTRTFEIVPGVYSAVSYIENANPDAGVRSVRYQFKLYDDRNVLVAERFGRMTIPPNRVVPVFEGGIDVGNRVPTRAFFTFLDDLVWERLDDSVSEIDVRDEVLRHTDVGPRVDAVVRNTGVRVVNNIVLIAVVFDDAGNAFTASRTLVETIDAGSEKKIAFTWPTQFALSPSRIDIIPLPAIPSVAN